MVDRHLDRDEGYESLIHIVPLWDQEHALILKFEKGDIVMVNELQFKIRDGVLRYED